MPQLALLPYQHDQDMAALSSVWLEASRIAHPFIGEAALLNQQTQIETVYLPASDTTVAWLGGAPVGFISMLGDFIGGLFVAPAAQGQGIGRSLIKRVAKDRQALELEVYTQNPQAFGFYTALGFVELSRRSHDAEGMPSENARLRLTLGCGHRK